MELKFHMRTNTVYCWSFFNFFLICSCIFFLLFLTLLLSLHRGPKHVKALTFAKFLFHVFFFLLFCCLPCIALKSCCGRRRELRCSASWLIRSSSSTAARESSALTEKEMVGKIGRERESARSDWAPCSCCCYCCFHYFFFAFRFGFSRATFLLLFATALMLMLIFTHIYICMHCIHKNL